MSPRNMPPKKTNKKKNKNNAEKANVIKTESSKSESSLDKIDESMLHMDNLLEVCSELKLDVDYLSVRERGKFATPRKELIRSVNITEDDPSLVIIVRCPLEAAMMKNASIVFNKQHVREELPEYLPIDVDDSPKLLVCNGVVHTWNYAKSVSEWRTFFQHCITPEEWVCNICETPEIPVTQVVSCRVCCKWLCKTCAEKLTVNQCPMCQRMDTLSCFG